MSTLFDKFLELLKIEIKLTNIYVSTNELFIFCVSYFMTHLNLPPFGSDGWAL